MVSCFFLMDYNASISARLMCFATFYHKQSPKYNNRYSMKRYLTATLLSFLAIAPMVNASESTDAYSHEALETVNRCGTKDLSIDAAEIKGGIVCYDCEDYVISAFRKYVFSVDDVDKSAITDYEWKLMLRNRDGFFEQAARTGTEDFLFSGVYNPEDFQVDEGGFIESILICDYKIGSKRYTTEVYPFHIDMAPVIEAMHSFNFTPGDEALYSMSFVVDSKGADRICVQLTQAYDISDIRKKEYSEGDRTEVFIARIDQWGKCWLEVTAYNAFSSSVAKKEFPKYDDLANVEEVVVNTSFDGDKGEARIFSLDGVVVYQGPELASYNDVLGRGIYVISVCRHGKTTTSKLSLR